MKRSLVFLWASALVFGIAGISAATYIETLDIYELSYTGGETITWHHSYDFSELLPYFYITLTVVADDLVGPGGGVPPDGENDEVYINGVSLGYLEQLPATTTYGLHPGPGNPDQVLTVSLFNVDPSLLDWDMEISVVLERFWEVEIEKSILTMQGTPVPEPATMLLLSSGLLGLAGFRRRFRKK